MGEKIVGEGPGYNRLKVCTVARLEGKGERTSDSEALVKEILEGGVAESGVRNMD